MTLAEVFLLLMFVAWYGVAAVTSEPGNVRELQLTIERLSKELESAKDDVAKTRKLEETNKFLKEILAAVSLYLRAPAPTSVDDIIERLKNHDEYVAQRAKRGSPPCLMNNNIIGVARVLRDEVEFQLLQSVSQTEGFEVGSILRGEGLRAFFREVLAYYGAQKKVGNDCRFDYRLEWSTDTDYRAGREQFEQPYFYLAGIRRVSTGD